MTTTLGLLILSRIASTQFSTMEEIVTDALEFYVPKWEKRHRQDLTALLCGTDGPYGPSISEECALRMDDGWTTIQRKVGIALDINDDVRDPR